MSNSLNDFNRTELYMLLMNAASEKLSHFETEYANQASTLTENNLKFYLENQNRLIEHWRNFLNFLKYNINHRSQKVQDGSLVQISTGKSIQWICIFKLDSELEILGEIVQINDGSLGRLSGSTMNAAVGDNIKLIGDGRGISDLNVKILRIL
jgi:hypothetical protein